MARAALEERETLLNLNAADRMNGGTWLVFSDDPAMLTRLKRVAEPHKSNGQGGYWFHLPVESVSFRKSTKGHRKTQAIEITGWEYQRLANAKYVSAQIHFSSREEKLSWTHHSIPPTKRVRSQNSPLMGDLEGKQAILVTE